MHMCLAGEWTLHLLRFDEESGEAKGAVAQMTADAGPSSMRVERRPSPQGLKTKTITNPYLQFKFS